jgi:radical SAM superfamily enzyme YgiQ (UPF0313 family)
MPNELKRILLIEPPFYRLFKSTYGLAKYPLALGYLAGAIRAETDWDVMTYNADFLRQSENWEVGYLSGAGFTRYLEQLKDLSAPIWQEVKSVISEYEPAVVGISIKSQSFGAARNVAQLAKEADEGIVVIAGGPHPSMVGREVLNCPYIDICVIGEGESTIVEVLEAIRTRKEFDGIGGVTYRKGNMIVENSRRDFVEDLDSLCFPHETAPDVLRNFDEYHPSAFSFIFATRGCPHNCIYCGSREVWSRKTRFRSPMNVVNEINGLMARGISEIHFDDDTFGINRKYIRDLCEALIKHCPGLKWSCEIHVKLVDEETIALMKNAGCYLIQIGIESGNNDILKAIRKNITIEEAYSACKIITKYGIRLVTFFMIGFPQETEATIRDTMNAMTTVTEIGCEYLAYSIFTPYPGTEAFELCKEQGLIDEDWDVSLYNHQSPANCFCANITPERFRHLASEVETMVDMQNTQRAEVACAVQKPAAEQSVLDVNALDERKNLRNIFSRNTLSKIREVGIRKAFRRGVEILMDK